MNRITAKDLKFCVDRLHKLTHTSNKYFLYFAYGGVKLIERNYGVDVFECGFTTKRDLYNRLCAFMQGIAL